MNMSGWGRHGNSGIHCTTLTRVRLDVLSARRDIVILPSVFPSVRAQCDLLVITAGWQHYDATNSYLIYPFLQYAERQKERRNPTTSSTCISLKLNNVGCVLQTRGRGDLLSWSAGCRWCGRCNVSSLSADDGTVEGAMLWGKSLQTGVLIRWAARFQVAWYVWEKLLFVGMDQPFYFIMIIDSKPRDWMADAGYADVRHPIRRSIILRRSSNHYVM